MIGLARVARLALLAAALLGAACAAGPRSFRAPGPGVPAGAVVALLPAINLTDNEEAPRLFTEKLILELGRLRHFRVQDPGVVLGYVRELRILVPDRMSRDQMAELGARCSADYFLVATITECTDGPGTPLGVPTAGVSLRLVHAASGSVVWASSLARSGNDQEILFGIGKIRNLDRLSAGMARDLVSGLRKIDRSGPPMLALAKKKATP